MAVPVYHHFHAGLPVLFQSKIGLPFGRFYLMSKEDPVPGQRQGHLGRV